MLLALLHKETSVAFVSVITPSCTVFVFLVYHVLIAFYSGSGINFIKLVGRILNKNEITQAINLKIHHLYLP
jgi:hypothetical protein